jgi:hypothetical protein
VIGEVVEVPITLTVAGKHISENVGATAGFLGYRDSLSVASSRLGGEECHDTSLCELSETGTSRILFPGTPSDPLRLFEVDAFLNDATSTSDACKTRYVYKFMPVAE